MKRLNRFTKIKDELTVHCGVLMLGHRAVIPAKLRNQAGADLGFFVPQSKFFGRRGVIGAGRGLNWAWSTTGGEGGFLEFSVRKMRFAPPPPSTY